MDNIKGLLAKKWKNELLELEPGHHEFDETLTIRVTGSVEKMKQKRSGRVVTKNLTIEVEPVLEESFAVEVA